MSEKNPELFKETDGLPEGGSKPVRRKKPKLSDVIGVDDDGSKSEKTELKGFDALPEEFVKAVENFSIDISNDKEENQKSEEVEEKVESKKLKSAYENAIEKTNEVAESYNKNKLKAEDVNSARSINELLQIIERSDGVEGSQESFFNSNEGDKNKEKLMTIIEMVKNGEIGFEYITRSAGLRQKVFDLMNQEVSNSEVPPPLPESTPKPKKTPPLLPKIDVVPAEKYSYLEEEEFIKPKKTPPPLPKTKKTPPPLPEVDVVPAEKHPYLYEEEFIKPKKTPPPLPKTKAKKSPPPLPEVALKSKKTPPPLPEKKYSFENLSDNEVVETPKTQESEVWIAPKNVIKEQEALPEVPITVGGDFKKAKETLELQDYIDDHKRDLEQKRQKLIEENQKMSTFLEKGKNVFVKFWRNLSPEKNNAKREDLLIKSENARFDYLKTRKELVELILEQKKKVGVPEITEEVSLDVLKKYIADKYSRNQEKSVDDVTEEIRKIEEEAKYAKGKPLTFSKLVRLGYFTKKEVENIKDEITEKLLTEKISDQLRDEETELIEKGLVLGKK